MHLQNCQTIASVLVVLLILGVPASATDLVILTSGQRHVGMIVEEDEHGIVMEIDSPGMTIHRRIQTGNIREIVRAQREGPAYAFIPVVGVIGEEVTADALRKALAEARRSQCEYVILGFRSDGGFITEVPPLIEVINDSRDLRIVAYVDKAISAAAVVALACPEIYFTERGTIGATVAWIGGPDGVPRNVDEKMQSAWRAIMRSATETSGHSPLFLRGMSEIEIELVLSRQPNGESAVMLSEDAPNGRMLKRRGEILALTAAEAEMCGLSRGTIKSIGGMKDAFGLEAWHSPSARPQGIMIATANAARIAAETRRRKAENTKYLGVVKDEVQRIRERHDQLFAAKLAARNGISHLQTQTAAAQREATAAYHQALAIAEFQSDPNAWIARAVEVYNDRWAQIHERHRQTQLTFEAKWTQADVELAQLERRLSHILASVPYPSELER